MKILGCIVTILTGALLIYGTTEFPDWGDPLSPASIHLSDYYIEKAMEETGAVNIVTAVLADYRGFDTMFETSVVFCAGLSCFLLLRNFGHKKDRYYRHIPTGVTLHIKNPDLPDLYLGKDFEDMDKDWVPPDMIIKTVCRIMVPFIQIYALYVLAHGDFSPGGGFQAGVIFGASLILLGISYNLKRLIKRINEKALGICAPAGVLIYAGIGALAMILGGNFLDYGTLLPLLPMVDPGHIRAMGMLGVEIGVGITVMAVMVMIYVNIVSQGNHDEGL